MKLYVIYIHVHIMHACMSSGHAETIHVFYAIKLHQIINLEFPQYNTFCVNNITKTIFTI